MKYIPKPAKTITKHRAPVVKNPEMFVSAFALGVTTGGNKPDEWIARSGPYSLQSALERMIPEAITFDSGKRQQMMTKFGTPAFQNVLENRCGFRTSRLEQRDCDA